MISSPGLYFDGISSYPQETEFLLDELNAGIRFGILSESTIFWSIHDMTFEHIGAVLEIGNKKHTLAHIKIDNENFSERFIDYLKVNGHVSWYQRIILLGMKAYLSIAVLILAVFVTGYAFLIPWVAEKSVLIIPQHYDITLGHTYYNQYLKDSSVDSIKTEALNRFAGHLKLNNTIKLHFTVINSPTINAFSLPDGNIIVHTGLIDSLTDYDELAGLIGHEASHINNRHSMKMICKRLSGYLFISVMLRDVNGITSIIGNNVNNLQSLSYSRYFERKADEEGTGLLILNGINPTGMTDLLTVLKSTEKVSMPAFISSHPITSNRIVSIKRFINHTPHSFRHNAELEELFLKIKN
jgi:predicted Zn-dependent protease